MNTPIVALALSLVLAVVFGASAAPKLRHPQGFVLAVLLYRVLPQGLSRLYARLVPPLELLLALLLVSGTAVRLAAVAAAALLVSFMVAVGINVARGRDLDCHCFGAAARRRVGWPLLWQDAALLGASLVLALMAVAWATPEPWSVLRLLGLVGPGSTAPLLGCLAVTAAAVTLLGRLAPAGRRIGDALTSR